MLALGLRTKIALCVLVGVFLSTAAAAGLVFELFHQQLSQATVATMNFTVFRVQEALEAAMNLGLALDELRGIDEILDRAVEQAADVQSIIVFNEDGRIVFATNSAEVGESVTPDLLSRANQLAVNQLAQETWAVTHNRTLVVGTGLSTSFGTPAGGIAARLPLAVIAQPLEDFGLHLVSRAFLVIGVVGLLSVAAALMLPLLTRGMLTAMTARLNTLAEQRLDEACDEGDARQNLFTQEVCGENEAADGARAIPDGLDFVDVFDQEVGRRLKLLRHGLAEVHRLEENA